MGAVPSSRSDHQLSGSPSQLQDIHTGRPPTRTVIFRAQFQEQLIELPTPYTIPVSWIKAHACAPIQWRTVRELLPPGSATDADLRGLRDAVRNFKEVQQVIKKQKDPGLWGGNILGFEADKGQGIKEPGTVFRYRQLLELGVPPTGRPFRLANRTLFRILSRDPDPGLLFEHKKSAKGDADFEEWARQFLREGATAALAQAGHIDDPRVRGALKRTVNRVSGFVRSDFSQEPIVKSGSRNVLAEEAFPPTLFLMSTLSYMPDFCRERAGFVERLVEFVTSPPPKQSYTIVAGSHHVKPTVQLLGDPIELDKSGKPKDIPLALHWIEILVRLGFLESSETAQTALAYLLEDVGEDGIWGPKGLRSTPKSSTGYSDFFFPLETGSGTEHRKTDMTFRLALVAKLAGCELSFS